MKGMTYPGHTKLLLPQRDVSVNTCFQLPVEPTFGRCPYFILQTSEECTAAANSLSQIPTPPPHFFSLEIYSFFLVTRSPKQEAPSRRHHQNAQQTCVTSLDLRAMEESLQQFCAKWQLDPEAQNFLRSDFLGMARNGRIPASRVLRFSK